MKACRTCRYWDWKDVPFRPYSHMWYKHFKNPENIKDHYKALCHKNPPIPNVGWPETTASDWCGGFEDR